MSSIFQDKLICVLEGELLFGGKDWHHFKAVFLLQTSNNYFKMDEGGEKVNDRQSPLISIWRKKMFKKLILLF
jgi:hypothetical protein